MTLSAPRSVGDTRRLPPSGLLRFAMIAVAASAVFAHTHDAHAQARRARPRRAQAAPQPQLTACQQLDSMDPAVSEDLSLLERASAEAAGRRDVGCLAKVSARYIARTECARGHDAASLAVSLAPNEPSAQCVWGLAEHCRIRGDATLQGTGDVVSCGAPLTRATDALAYCGELENDPSAAAAAVRSIIDTAEVCRDDGDLFATATVLAADFDVRSRELDVLRADTLPYLLTDANLVVRLSDWLSSGARAMVTTPTLRARSAEFLRRMAAANRVASPTNPVLVSGRALLALEGATTRLSPSNYGQMTSTVQWMLDRGLLAHAPIAQALGQLPLIRAAAAPVPDAELARLRTLRQGLRRVNGPERSLAMLGLGITTSVRSQQPPCDRARQMLEVLSDFEADPGARSLPLAHYGGALLEAAREGGQAASACPQGGRALVHEFDRVVERLEAGSSPFEMGVDFQSTATVAMNQGAAR
ncbi:MAG: hypothetical protein JNK05_06280 [Myxococcales bacterium]|nr:hypothetical protein [Myxococcales bacterium]